MTGTTTTVTGEPFRRRAAVWLFDGGGGVAAAAASALFVRDARWWPFPHRLDCVLIAAGVLAMVPWLVMAARDWSWRRAYRLRRVTRDQYRAYLASRTGNTRGSA